MNTAAPDTLQAAAPGQPFSCLPLAQPLLDGLQQLGFAQMTAVQERCLPQALQGADLIVQAQTGSGKTAAFGLTLLHKLNARWFAAQGLVLCPTRELADQVAVEIRRLARTVENIKVVTLCGGVPMRAQIANLEYGAHIVVGTPGRIMDHLERGTLNLDQLSTLVLDEADRMLDMGFLDDIQHIASHLPRQRQTLLFSATYPDSIADLARRFMQTPERITVDAASSTPRIAQRFFEIEASQRLNAVARLLDHFRPVSSIAFCNTKQQCRDLVDVLTARGISALALHGDLEQRERDQVLAQFANRSCSVLAATDVASRGIDIKELEAVINVDIARDPAVHVHRVGRTGRAGEAGLALSLAARFEKPAAERAAQATGQEAHWESVNSLPAQADMPWHAPMVTLQILGGRKEKIRPGDVLGALTGGDGGPEIAREHIGKIQVTDFCTFIGVARDVASQACDKLNAGRVKGRSVKARLLA